MSNSRCRFDVSILFVVVAIWLAIVDVGARGGDGLLLKIAGSFRVKANDARQFPRQRQRLKEFIFDFTWCDAAETMPQSGAFD